MRRAHARARARAQPSPRAAARSAHHAVLHPCPAHRFCDPAALEKHERRNPQPPVLERPIELLVYGIFTAYDGYTGEHATAWVDMSEVIMSIGREATASTLASFRDSLGTALQHALSPAAWPAPSPAAAAAAATAAAADAAAADAAASPEPV